MADLLYMVMEMGLPAYMDFLAEQAKKSEEEAKKAEIVYRAARKMADDVKETYDRSLTWRAEQAAVIPEFMKHLPEAVKRTEEEAKKAEAMYEVAKKDAADIKDINDKSLKWKAEKLEELRVYEECLAQKRLEWERQHPKESTCAIA